VGLVHSYLYRQKPDVRANWKRAWGGGHIVENQIHPIDLARYVVGEVSTVFARYGEEVLRGSEDWDNWDSYSVCLRFAGGAVGSVSTTYAAFPGIPHAMALDIVAEDVVLRFEWDKLTVFTPDGMAETVEAQERPTFTIGREFLHAVETGDRSRLRESYADAARSLEVCLAANESAVSGRVIHLAPQLTGTLSPPAELGTRY
jgi:myo-inositol 2-dehydrogenase / D-chiro-inositol 1-dehydrogenase